MSTGVVGIAISHDTSDATPMDWRLVACVEHSGRSYSILRTEVTEDGINIRVEVHGADGALPRRSFNMGAPVGSGPVMVGYKHEPESALIMGCD